MLKGSIMKNPNYALAKQKAFKTLEENSIINPPIIAQKICENYGIKVIFGTFKDEKVSGMMDFKSNTIYVNDLEAYTRNNFTIAHELGHYFLHRDLYLECPDKYEVLYRTPINYFENSDIEKEANTFAANLLVPKKILDEYYEIATIQSLAKLFVVSEEVIGFRLKYEYKY